MPDLATLIDLGARVRLWRSGPTHPEGRCVIYWMQRSQRGRDNPALDVAIEAANLLRLPVLAVFGLTADDPGAERRHLRFLADALPEIAAQLAARRVGFVVRLGRPDVVVARLAIETTAALVVGDENPLRVGRAWRAALADRLRVPFATVDSDVVVPTAFFPREEYAARTLRPKIQRELPRFLIPSPNPSAAESFPESRLPHGAPLDPDVLLDRLGVAGAGEVPDYPGGPREADRRLDRFVRERLSHYANQRNELRPCRTTELSAHLHFGHISPVTVALAAQRSGAPPEAITAFHEELIVRRELAINFVARNPDYDSLRGCPAWARNSLAKHAGDRRPFLYAADRLEAGETHDPLWNAAQKDMVLTGRMPNYLRMYWAKKLLEWTPDATTAFAIAVALNDRYEMDGRDPNGYAGIAWAIGGKHDRPWPERPIFGLVRTMAASGVARKFDVADYLHHVDTLKRSRA